MRRSALLFAIFPLLAACAYLPGIGGIGGSGARSDGFRGATDGPLRVRLHPPAHGFLSFAVSEPAYIAVFEVAPDRGISLLYPYYRDQSEYASADGINTRTLPWNPRGRWYYANTAFQPYFSWGLRPTYLYIIASKHPLDVEEIVRSPGRLHRTLGWSTYLVSNLSRTLDRLESMVVRGAPEDDWSTDIYVLWPRAQMSDRRHVTRIVCRDGSVMLVPEDYNIHACPGLTNIADATRPTAPTPQPGVQRREPGDARPPRPRDGRETPKIDTERGGRSAPSGTVERPQPAREAPARRPEPATAPPSRPEPATAPAPRPANTRPQPAEPETRTP